MNDDKTYQVFKEGAITTVSGEPLKLEDQFTYLGSNISSTENNNKIRIWKVWTTTDTVENIEIWFIEKDYRQIKKWNFKKYSGRFKI